MDKKLQAAHAACLKHAEDVLQSAESLVTANKSHIAYHLAALALEEIGKAALIVASGVAAPYRETAWADRKLDDHEWKLSWAIWTPAIGGGKTTPQALENARNLARTIHHRRQAGMYFEADGNSNFREPSEIVTKEHTEQLMDFVRARLVLEQSGTWDTGDQNGADLEWLLTATEDSDRSKRVFNAKSMKILEQCGGDPKRWIKAVKEQIAEEDAAFKLALEKEVARAIPNGQDAQKPKWKVRVKLRTASHKIKPRPLANWTKIDAHIQLHPVPGKKDQLYVDIVLPASVPMSEVYRLGWDAHRKYALSLNIATLGFFWWELPEDGDSYLESVRDLDSNQVVKMGTGPTLLDWRKSNINDGNLIQVAQCMYALSRLPPEAGTLIFSPYLQAMAFLGKSDVHHSFAIEVADLFVTTFSRAIAHFSELDVSPAALENSMRSAVTDVLSPAMADELVPLAMKAINVKKTVLEEHDAAYEPITIADAAKLKVTCDAYLRKHLLHLATERIAKEYPEMTQENPAQGTASKSP
ncbi:AbiV family abortive infection protein [Ferrovibrio terrae]|uniref:AbiV family abortive infection protein n=1 Tax=Ferrovibrio terrae TaxID=2594003 RepID=UPI00313833B2